MKKEISPDYEDKMKIAKYPIWEKLTVRKLGLSRKIIQRAYKEMKQMNFRSDIIDYLCYDSLSELVANVTMGIEIIGSFKKTFEYVEAYLDIYQHITVLVCRLLLKDKTYLEELFNQHGISKNDKIFKETQKILVKRINSLLKYKP